MCSEVRPSLPLCVLSLFLPKMTRSGVLTSLLIGIGQCVGARNQKVSVYRNPRDSLQLTTGSRSILSTSYNGHVSFAPGFLLPSLRKMSNLPGEPKDILTDSRSLS